MEKDKLIEEMLKDMGDRNNTIDLNAYGRGLIDMYDRLVKKISIPDVVFYCSSYEDGEWQCKTQCSTCVESKEMK